MFVLASSSIFSYELKKWFFVVSFVNFLELDVEEKGFRLVGFQVFYYLVKPVASEGKFYLLAFFLIEEFSMSILSNFSYCTSSSIKKTEDHMY